MRQGRIASRRAGTDTAILDAIREFPPCPVLDVGCGEGWLARSLGPDGYEVTGIDASGSLIADARKGGGGSFLELSYEDLARFPSLLDRKFGLIVANFSLLSENILPLLETLRSRLTEGGAVIIQTLHPFSLGPNVRYEAGWRIETFAQVGNGFVARMPYYFRTFSHWIEQLSAARMSIVHCREPLDPETGRPLSLLIVAR